MRIGKAIYNMTKWFGCKGTLCEAAANGDTRAILQLLESNADPNEREGGWSPLHFAARHGETSVIDVLLVHGADVTATDELGWPSINTAVRFRQTQFVRELLMGTSGELIDLSRRDNRGQTALHLAARWDRDGQITAILLEHGVHPGSQDASGVTPLHIAANYGNLVFVETLLDKADFVEVTISGMSKTPADVAVESGHPSIAKLISDYAANQRLQPTRLKPNP